LGLVVATRERLSRKTVLTSLLATALLLAGAVSLFASTRPDGLEWTYKEHFAGADAPVGNSSPTVAAVDDWQSRWSLMTDYSKRSAPLGRRAEATVEGQGADNASWPNLDGWVSLAGILGTAVTLAIVYIVSAILRRRSCRQAPPPQNQAC
jgi:cobalt/nickel transport system permease protein